MLKSYGLKEDIRRQYDVLVPLETPYGETMGIEFLSDATNNWLVGSALRTSPLGLKFGLGPKASPFAFFGAFLQKHKPDVSSALRASPFEHHKCPAPTFSLVLCPLHGLGLPQSTPTTLSVN